MTIEKIKYFVLAAQCLSFSQVAKNYYISQAAVSQQISSLEKELDVKLFVRSHVQLSLTEEGKIFYKECRKILEHYNNALEKITDYKNEQLKILKIGYSSAFEKDLLSRSMRNFDNMEDIKIKFICLTISELKQALQNEELDIVLTIDTEFPSNIQKTIIYSDSFLLGVSLSNPLSKRNEVDASVLANESIILFEEDSIGSVQKDIIRHCKEDGYVPNIVETVTSMESMLLSVELGRGVGFFPPSQQYLCNDAIHFLKIKNTHHNFKVCATWRNDNKSPYINQIIKSLSKDGYK